jgi:hypothetical protein
MPTEKSSLIFAFGFDAAGFPLASDAKDSSVPGHELRYVGYHDSTNLADADGVIFMSGIFETEHVSTDYMEQRHKWFDYDEHHLALREKEIFQLLRKQGWIGVLLRRVENGHSEKWARTDLAKRLLNSVFDTVIGHHPNPHVKCKRDEFREYLERYGISETAFRRPSRNQPVQVIADTDSGIAAAEALGSIFFLPMRSLKKDSQQLRTALSLCVSAITMYIRRNRIYLPAWVEGLKFKTEISLQAESETIQQRLFEIERSLQDFQSYRAILTTSGDKLRELVIKVLRDYFHVNVTEQDNNIEDTIITSDSKDPMFVAEIKGVRGGLKREYVNQVDSHRERLGLTADVAGLLISNDFMEVEGLTQRAVKEFDTQHLKHATNLNLRILRMSALFTMMLGVEQLSPKQRAAEFLRVCREGNPMVVPDLSADRR